MFEVSHLNPSALTATTISKSKGKKSNLTLLRIILIIMNNFVSELYNVMKGIRRVLAN